MAQYLVAIYHTDDYDPFVETEAMIEEIHALNRELIAAGARKFACGLSPASNAGRCGSSPMARCSSPTGHTWRPRSRWAVFGCWTPLIWTRHSSGDARVPPPARHRSRCGRFFSSRTRSEQRNSLPLRLRNMHRLDHRMNQPARSYAAGSHPEGRGEEQ